jgi:signal transduction histidine kinase/putative methionine-R-sulfoxide reductase with GAF domain
MRRGAKPAKAKGESRNRESSKVRTLEKRLAEARQREAAAVEQQTATSEILRVISRSPTDIQPVLSAVAENATRLCNARDVSIALAEGDVLKVAASYGTMARWWPDEGVPINRGSVTGRAFVDRRPVNVHDLAAASDEEFPQGKVYQRGGGHRTNLAIPLLRDGVPIGVIAIRRIEVRPFTDKQITLLETFADQAVIAIENVRLFKALEARNRDVTEALEHQIATAEVLRAISSSAMDTQPVFQAIVESAVRLSGALFGSVYRFDGALIHMTAHHNYPNAALEFSRRFFPAPPGRQTFTGRAILERAVVHVPDVSQDTERLLARDLAETVGFRSALAVPMLHEGNPIGAITVWRADVGPFSDTHVALLQTFADQAVIAIQNERLFKELQARTGELSRSVEKLTALGEVGRAVSSTLDLETVLTTIVSRAVELAGLEAGAIYEYDEMAEVFHLRATQNLSEEFLEIARPLALPKGEGATGRLAVTREPVQIPDVAAPGAYRGRLRDILLRLGHRALLAVPLISENHIVGGLVVNRRQPGEFEPDVIDLLKTFATQSALAIQNAKLFRELQDKSRQLEVASQHKSEFLANMSHELRTPLNAVIGFSEVLAERMFGDLNEKQEEYLKDIHASGQHLLSLINDILDLSKIEAGRMELELTDFHLPAALDHALTLVRERAARRGIALQTNVDERLGQIQADERKIRQVVLNLLSNAIKFTPEGGRIAVGAVLRDGFVEVSVSDTGVGIAPEDQEAVFEEFRQVGTAEKKAEGTGLGLTLCRRFVELHGGRIWVTSQVGIGSTFTFTLPLALDQAGQIA